MKQKKSLGKRERGVALLMVLGVLSLLLILAMSFSFSASTDRQAAANSAELVRARLLAQSGLDRAQAFLMLSFRGVDDPAFQPEHLFPATSGAIFGKAANTTVWGDDRYYSVSAATGTQSRDAAGLETALAVDLGFDYTPNADPDTLSTNASWQHVTNEAGDVVGRIAFLICDESGKLDPGACITPRGEPYDDANGNGSRDAGEVYFDLDNSNNYSANLMVSETDGSNNAGVPSIRVGLSPQEILLGDDDFRTEIFTYANGDLVPDWFSWRHIAKEVRTPTGPDDDMLRYLFPYSFDLEAFHQDGTPGTDKHRFNLYRDWSTTSMTDLETPAADFWSAPGVIGAPGGGIPWLEEIQASGDFTGLDDDAVRAQIRANLIDFCDTDSVATAGPGSAPYQYVGLEKVPYLSEIEFEITLVQTGGNGNGGGNNGGGNGNGNAGGNGNGNAGGNGGGNGGGGGGGPTLGDLYLHPVLEIANIYGESLSLNNITVTVGIQVDNGAVESHTFTGNPGSVSANSYLEYDGLGTYTKTDIVLNGNGNNARIPVRITSISFEALTSQGLADAGAISQEASGEVRANGNTSYASVRAIDPRANTLDSCWFWYEHNDGDEIITSASHGSPPPHAQAKGLPNSMGQPNDDPSDPLEQLVPYANDEDNFDLEETHDIVGEPSKNRFMSTAYIPNRYPKSLWELGAIHRGEPWRTLNFHDYSDAPDGTYAQGDVPILDQVKAGPFNKVRGKVNVNTPNTEVWTRMLTGVTYGADGYDDPASGTLILPAEALTIGQAIIAETSSDPFPIRSAVAKVPEITTIGGMDDDRSREEAVCKIVQLLTARQNVFNVIVTAQTVKDLKGTVKPVVDAGRTETNWVQYDTSAADPKWLAVLAEQRIMATVYRDAVSNKFEVIRMEYLED